MRPHLVYVQGHFLVCSEAKGTGQRDLELTMALLFKALLLLTSEKFLLLTGPQFAYL